MDVSVRTVRLLDRKTGETPTQPASPRPRIIDGFTIETGIPIPARTQHSPLVNALAALEPGESIQHTHDAKYQRSKVTRQHPGRSFLSRRIPWCYEVPDLAHQITRGGRP